MAVKEKPLRALFAQNCYSLEDYDVRDAHKAMSSTLNISALLAQGNWLQAFEGRSVPYFGILRARTLGRCCVLFVSVRREPV